MVTVFVRQTTMQTRLYPIRRCARYRHKAERDAVPAQPRDAIERATFQATSYSTSGNARWNLSSTADTLPATARSFNGARRPVSDGGDQRTSNESSFLTSGTLRTSCLSHGWFAL